MKNPMLSTAALVLIFQATVLGAAAPPPAPQQAQETMKKKQPYPPVQPAREIHFPAFEEKTLANGLRVVVIEQHETPSVTIEMLVRAGKAFTPSTKAGLPSATAQLLHEGTTTRSAQQIAQAIDSIGGSLDTYGSWDSAGAVLQVTSDQLDLGLDLFSDVILHPSFPAEELERWQRQSLNNLQVQQEDPAYLADSAFQRAVYADHPYGLPEDGTPESVRAITRDDLVAFHREHYLPNEAILAVVGDVKAADAVARVERAFGSWARGEDHEIPKVAAASGDKHRIVVIDMPDAVQSEIRVGQIGVAFTDPDYFAAEVYSSVLGGGPSARLYQEVRNKRGLSYGASSSFLKAVQPGPFSASTFTKTESTVEALQVMLDTIEALAKAPVPAAELEARKTYLSGVFPLEIETPGGIANKVLEALKYGLGREFIESYRGRIDAVTAGQVQSFAERRIHPGSALIVVAGNAGAFLPDLQKKLGPAEVIPYKEIDLLRPDLRKAGTEKPAG
ncbi:MAG TPA: pitrilysin family protein [Thermoanaerobaculia bacterium]|nr:pitrilysin family protein [Thermoanaerobaculia bacterium]